jgi:hypothetical protein
LYLDTGLFEHLATDALLESLTKLKDTAGRFPVMVVTPTHHKDAPIVADNDPGDADRVLGRVRHGRPPWSGRWVT